MLRHAPWQGATSNAATDAKTMGRAAASETIGFPAFRFRREMQIAACEI